METLNGLSTRPPHVITLRLIPAALDDVAQVPLTDFLISTPRSVSMLPDSGVVDVDVGGTEGEHAMKVVAELLCNEPPNGCTAPMLTRVIQILNYLSAESVLKVRLDALCKCPEG